VVIHRSLADTWRPPTPGTNTALLELWLFASQSKSASTPTTSQLN
jgi:hypothetical protein